MYKLVICWSSNMSYFDTCASKIKIRSFNAAIIYSPRITNDSFSFYEVVGGLYLLLIDGGIIFIQLTVTIWLSNKLACAMYNSHKANMLTVFILFLCISETFIFSMGNIYEMKIVASISHLHADKINSKHKHQSLHSKNRISNTTNFVLSSFLSILKMYITALP